MNIREVFSGNLRGLCRERGTVARIERETGIGRVQINRYLNGTIPKTENLALLAAFFEVDETDFFQVKCGATTSLSDGISDLLRPLQGILRQEPTARLPDSAYNFITPMSGDKNYAVKSAVFVKTVGGMKTYRSITREAPPNQSSRSQFQSIKSGIILERRGHFYFAGLSRVGFKEPAFAVASRLPITIPLLFGQAIFMHMDQPGTFDFIAKQIRGTTGVSEIIAACGIVRISTMENGDLYEKIFKHRGGASSMFSV